MFKSKKKQKNKDQEIVDNVVAQEFYCNDCENYISVTLNMSLNIAVVIVCPNCGRRHPRSIKNGQIFETGISNNNYEICPVIFYKKSRANSLYERKGVPLSQADRFVKDAWFELHGAKI